MRVLRVGIALVLLVLGELVLDAHSLLLFSSGITGYSGKSGVTCSVCHSGGTPPTVTLSGPTQLKVDERASYTITISGGQKAGAGIDIAKSRGRFFATDSNTRVQNTEIIHNSPFVGDPISVAFDLQAPPTPGTVTLYAAGNSVNRNGGTSGDAPATTTFVIQIIDPCDVKFAEFGMGLSGSGGFVPHLTGTDGTCDGTYQVHLKDGLGGASCLLWAGLGQTNANLFGGEFYVDLSKGYMLVPLILNGAAGVAGDGSIDVTGIDLSVFSGQTVYLQASLADPGAIHGVSLSNGLTMTIDL